MCQSNINFAVAMGEAPALIAGVHPSTILFVFRFVNGSSFSSYSSMFSIYIYMN